MAEEFFISDQHYGHKNILGFTDEAGDKIRPEFSCVEEMNEVMIDRHNSVVKDGDTVYLGGDFIWGKNCSETRNLFHNICCRLHGNLIVMPGNHDHLAPSVYSETRRGVSPGRSVTTYDYNSMMQFRDRPGIPDFMFCHYPLHICNLRYEVRNKGQANGVKQFYCVHGHIHQRRVLTEDGLPDPLYINVSVEHIDYTPINIDELFK